MDDAESSQNNNYSSIKEDLQAILKLVNAYVKVHLIKNCSYVGFVHSIDPVTHSIILSVPKEDAYQTIVIPGHAILNVTNETPPANIKPPKRKESPTHSIDDLLRRKKRLISWLKSNLLPVTELDDRIIIGNVTLLQPYNISDISTDNPIVAMQIRNVIEKMPHDFESK
uniref:AD domain-containing protein n=1 Tax=Heliothis virescens TaxID=7102 RepID=A0A2A4JTP8_HELVI